MSDCYNLQKLHQLFNSFSTTLNNEQEFKNFLTFLYINQLIDSNDLNIIPNQHLVFPMTFDRFINTIAQHDKPTLLKDLDKAVDQLYQQLNDCRTTLKTWNLNTFSIDELKSTVEIYENIQNEYNELHQEIKQFTESVLIVNQPLQSLKNMLASFPTNDLTPLEYQNKKRDLIQKEFSKIRVKQVQYRNQPIKILKQFSNANIIQLGFDFNKDYPIEVWKLPKKTWNLSGQSNAIYTFEAHHELLLSQRFPKYLGSNLHQDEHYYQHFMQLTRGHTLRYLMKHSNNDLQVDMPLFRVILKEIFEGLRDLCYMCQYEPQLPITLQNIQVQRQGGKIILKNISFIGMKQQDMEPKLLENLGHLILTILQIKRNELHKLDDHLGLKNLVEALLQAEEDSQLYQQKIIQNKLNFSQLAGHDLFDDELIGNIEMEEVAQNYHELYSQCEIIE